MTSDVLAEWMRSFPPGIEVLLDDALSTYISNIFYLPVGKVSPCLMINMYTHHHSGKLALFKDEHGAVLLKDGMVVIIKRRLYPSDPAEHVQYLPNDWAIIHAYFSYLWYHETFGEMPPYPTAWEPYRVSTDGAKLNFLRDGELAHSIDLPI